MFSPVSATDIPRLTLHVFRQNSSLAIGHIGYINYDLVYLSTGPWVGKYNGVRDSNIHNIRKLYKYFYDSNLI